MDCGCGSHHNSQNDCGGGHSDSGCCGQGHGLQRKFKTKDEKLEMLKSYQTELEAELQAVKEKLTCTNK